jgi:pilus assembly protein CpaE
MADKIRVLIVDDSPETRENVRKLLQFERDVEVIAQAGDGDQAIEAAKQHQPDVILMDINMPGRDGISASQAITRAVPVAQIIIMSVQSEADYLRRAMLAGARDFLMKPFSADELMAAIRRVYDTRPAIAPMAMAAGSAGAAAAAKAAASQGKVIAVYSPKGGSGCTTIAINLAVALASKGHKTALIDASLQFGDVAVTLNMRPSTSIIDLIDRVKELDADLVTSVMIEHSSGLRVLLAPPRPEMAELVTAEHMDALLKNISQQFQYIIVDTQSALNDVTLDVLDVADRIVLVTQQSLSSLTNTRRFFDLIDELNYDSSKSMLVVNRSLDKLGISVKDVGDALKKPVLAVIPADEIAATNAADRGQPLAGSSRGRRDPLVNAYFKVAELIEKEFSEGDGDDKPTASAKQDGGGKQKKSFFSRLFGK